MGEGMSGNEGHESLESVLLGFRASSEAQAQHICALLEKIQCDPSYINELGQLLAEMLRLHAVLLARVVAIELRILDD